MHYEHTIKNKLHSTFAKKYSNWQSNSHGKPIFTYQRYMKYIVNESKTMVTTDKTLKVIIIIWTMKNLQFTHITSISYIWMFFFFKFIYNFICKMYPSIKTHKIIRHCWLKSQQRLCHSTWCKYFYSSFFFYFVFRLTVL